MLCFVDRTTDPYYNLAVEEHLLTNYDQPIFRLWRNSPAVIIGRNQNALAEINSEYVHSHNIPVVRRLSGGGAVFHDLGNINFTFIDKRVDGEDSHSMFRRFTEPILTALNRIGVNASLEGRNDLTIDGRKISGNALCVHKDRVLQHGTLLFSSSMNDLSLALKTRPEKFKGKAVKSNIARVTNIQEHLPSGVKDSMSAEGFMDYLTGFIMSQEGQAYSHRTYSDFDKKSIKSLVDSKYGTDEWNFGKSPKYQYSATLKLSCGLIEVFCNVVSGIITDCRIMGDFFFVRPIEEIEHALIGLPHSHSEIAAALSTYPLSDYFGTITTADLTKLICG